jgi:iron complex outermembrane recepter protein
MSRSNLRVESLPSKSVLSTSILVAMGMTGPALAQAQDDGIEDIIVTAEFREQNLQETPLAISAFSGELLEARGATDTNDIDMFVPNAVIQPLGAGWGSTVAAFVRGIGLNDNILSYEPGVPIYVDDVYLGRNQGAIMDLLDLERVEVLRGPQGTLFGKNAIGGTVRFISSKPTGDGGQVSVTVGERNRLNVRGMFDTAIVPDKLLVRIAGSSKTQDGYFDILDYECVNGPGSLGGNGGAGNSPIFPGVSFDLGSATNVAGNCVVDELGNENVQSGRGTLLWNASDNVEVTFTADVTRQRQKGPADEYVRFYRPGTPEGGLPEAWNFLVGAPIFGLPWDNRFLTPSPYTNYNRYVDPISGRTFPNVNNLDASGMAMTIEWSLGDNVVLKSITAQREFDNEFGRTSSGSAIPLDLTYDVTKHDQVTQEFQLTGSNGRLDWATGLFYYTADDSNYQSGTLFPGLLYQQDSFDSQDSENWAVFVHGVFSLTDKLSLTAGVRYTDDQKVAQISRHNFDGTDRLPVPGFTTQTSPGTVIVDEDKVSPTLGIDYQMSDNVMLFALYSTGFRGGGFSPRPSNGLQLAPFLSEELENYEVGVKSEMFDDSFRVNANLFMSTYTDQQVFLGTLDPSGALWFHQTNSGESEYWGVEVETMWRPGANFALDSALGYIHHELTDPGVANTCITFQNGDPCYSTRTPEWTFALGGAYEFKLRDGGSVTARIDGRYQSKVYFLPYGSDLDPVRHIASNPIEGVQEGYTVYNGRVTWLPARNEWELALYGINLTDEVYFNGKLPLIGLGLGREQGNVAAPREYGVTITRHF